jgi:hypothetical protein
MSLYRKAEDRYQTISCYGIKLFELEWNLSDCFSWNELLVAFSGELREETAVNLEVFCFTKEITKKLI